MKAPNVISHQEYPFAYSYERFKSFQNGRTERIGKKCGWVTVYKGVTAVNYFPQDIMGIMNPHPPESIPDMYERFRLYHLARKKRGKRG